MRKIRRDSTFLILCIIIVISVLITSLYPRVSISNIPPSSKFSAKQTATNHTITAPIIILPIEGSTHNETVTIEWIEASDSEGHKFTYTLDYSRLEIRSRVWNSIAHIENQTSYFWDTAFVTDGIIHLRLTAECSSGLISSDIIQIEIRHTTPPIVRIAVILFIIAIVILILFLPALLKKRQKSSVIGISIKEKDQFTLGIAIGLFDENRGFRIEQKNKFLSSMFDDSEILSSLMYSARMYQPDKLDTLYGPFPMLGKDDIHKNLSFEVYWTKLIDKSSVDPRIIKNLMKIPIVLLFVYDQELQQIFDKRRKDIMVALQTATVTLKDVESINENSCLMIQNLILERLQISQ